MVGGLGHEWKSERMGRHIDFVEERIKQFAMANVSACFRLNISALRAAAVSNLLIPPPSHTLIAGGPPPREGFPIWQVPRRGVWG